MTLGHWEYFFVWPAASTSTSTGAAGGFQNRRLIGAGLAVSNITDVRL